MEIPIRVATMADVPTLRDLIPLSARELSKNYYTPQQVESAITYIFGVDTQLIDDGTYYVAEADGQIVGCGGWSKRKTMFGGDQMKDAQDPMLRSRARRRTHSRLLHSSAVGAQGHWPRHHPGLRRGGAGRRLFPHGVGRNNARRAALCRHGLYRHAGALTSQWPTAQAFPLLTCKSSCR